MSSFQASAMLMSGNLPMSSANTVSLKVTESRLASVENWMLRR